MALGLYVYLIIYWKKNRETGIFFANIIRMNDNKYIFTKPSFLIKYTKPSDKKITATFLNLIILIEAQFRIFSALSWGDGTGRVDNYVLSITRWFYVYKYSVQFQSFEITQAPSAVLHAPRKAQANFRQGEKTLICITIALYKICGERTVEDGIYSHTLFTTTCSVCVYAVCVCVCT